jgi:hypothetical protein
MLFSSLEKHEAVYDRHPRWFPPCPYVTIPAGLMVDGQVRKIKQLRQNTAAFYGRPKNLRWCGTGEEYLLAGLPRAIIA